MRLPLTTLEVFTAIARKGSLRAAAEALDIKPSTVSHQLKYLEEQLGTALFIRTTRSVSLTEAGRALIQDAGPAFDQLSKAVQNARSTGRTAQGALKLAMPEFVYHLSVGPVLTSFCKEYPGIELEISLTDALSDILEEEFHAGFRLGDKIAQDMVAVRVTRSMALCVVGSPEYLATHGTPETPRDLFEHNCVRYRFHSSGRIAPWTFTAEEGDYTVDVPGSLITNTMPASVEFAVNSLGLVFTFSAFVAEETAKGTLIPVLEDHLGSTPGVFMFFPREYRSMTPLRLFMEHLRNAQRDQ